MFMMQNNDPRLIKAAKRTIRAEVTLVLVILVITAWSVYALYKLTVDGSGTIFGVNFSKSSQFMNTKSLVANFTDSLNDLNKTIGGGQSTEVAESTQHPAAATIQQQQRQPNEIRLRILKELLAANQRQREFVNVGGNQQAIVESGISSYPSNILDELRLLKASASGHLALDTGNRFSDAQLNGKLKANKLLEDEHHHNQQMIEMPQNSWQQLTALQNLNSASPINTRLINEIEPKIAFKTSAASTKQKLDNNSSTEDEDYFNESLRADQNLGGSSTNDDDDDRQAAESSREPSESITVETNENPESIVNGVESDNNQPSTDNDSEELSSQSNDEQQQQDKQQEDSNQVEDISFTTGNEESSPTQEEIDDQKSHQNEEQKDDISSEDDPSMSLSSLNDEGHTVDEAVDRMTQPSQQQATKSFNYNKGTVQFDDSLNIGLLLGGATTSNSDQHQILMKNSSLAAGDLIARFASPSVTNSTGTGNDDDEPSISRQKDDLQFDHNKPVVSSGADSKKPLVAKVGNKIKKNSTIATERNQVRSQVTRSRKEFNRTGEAAASDVMSPRDRLNLLLSNRQKRSYKKIGLHTVKAPYEISDSHNNNYKVRNKRAVDSAIILNETTATTGTGKDLLNTTSPKYHYSTYNSKYIQELLDALKQTELPPPKSLNTETDSDKKEKKKPPPPKLLEEIQQPSKKREQVQRSKDVVLMNNNGEQSEMTETNPLVDEKLEDSNYITTAASGEGHKSMSMKKKKKHEKEKHKKKMSVGLKKGGHKKKKHKKEMKKYVKEKKFKGAKKGKKEAKGKGGQGGKKGKKLYKDKGFKKRGFKNVYHKEEFGQKKSYFDEFRDKDFKKKWKKFDDKYNYAQMKKWQAKDVKGAKKIKDHGEKYNKYDKSKWKKKYQKQFKEHSASSKKKKKAHELR